MFSAKGNQKGPGPPNGGQNWPQNHLNTVDGRNPFRTTEETNGKNHCLLVFAGEEASFHGCCWETFYIVAYCGLVGNPDLTTKI